MTSNKFANSPVDERIYFRCDATMRDYLQFNSTRSLSNFLLIYWIVKRLIQM